MLLLSSMLASFRDRPDPAARRLPARRAGSLAAPGHRSGRLRGAGRRRRARRRHARRHGGGGDGCAHARRATSSARGARASTPPATPAVEAARRPSSCSSTTTSRRRRPGCASCSTDGGAIPRRSCSAARSSCGWRARGCRCAGASRRRSRRSTPVPRTARSRSCGAPTWRPTAARSSWPGCSTRACPYGFDEDMWERRLRDAGGRVMYVARAGLVHRRDHARLAPAPVDARRLPARAQPARLHRAPRRGALGAARSCACWPAACGTSSAAAAATACC